MEHYWSAGPIGWGGLNVDKQRTGIGGTPYLGTLVAASPPHPRYHAHVSRGQLELRTLSMIERKEEIEH